MGLQAEAKGRCASRALAWWQHRLCYVHVPREGGRQGAAQAWAAGGRRDAQGVALPKGGRPLRAPPLSRPPTPVAADGT